MKRFFLTLLAIAAFSQPSYAVQIGQSAPDFRATDSNGDIVHLSDFHRKIVVLEWNNPDCPFVAKHYNSGNMQRLQSYTADKGVVWLTVNSSAPGREGNVDAAKANAFIAKRSAKPAHYLLDADGTIGKLYGAKSTPHMFVIDADGKLVYQGAIDDKPTADPKDIAPAHNYVRAAIDSLLAGKPVETAETQSYGCSVKYEK